MLVLGLLALCPAAWSQEAPAEAAGKSDELVHTAKFLKEKLDDLLVEMSKVAQLMEETEPDVAKILRQTVEHAQREDVSQKLDRVVETLRGGLDEAARKSQSAVIGDLRQMLRILEGGAKEESKTDKLLAERKAMLERIKDLIARQEAEERRTRAAAHAEKIDKETAQLIADLENLIRRQEKVAGQTKDLPERDEQVKKLDALRQEIRKQIEAQDKLSDATAQAGISQLPVLGEAQKKLGDEAKGLAEKVAEAAKGAGKAGDAVKKAAEHVTAARSEMQRAGEALGTNRSDKATGPQGQAGADLRAAEKSLGEAIKALSAGTPGDALSQQQGQLGKDTEAMSGKADKLAEQAGLDPKNVSAKPAGDLNKAAGHMNEAADRIGSGDKKPAGDEQNKALEELRKELARAQDLRRKAMEEAKKKLDAANQEKIAGGAKDTAEKMAQDSDGKPMAGKSSMDRAAGKASSAGKQMAGGQSGKANKDQNDALEEMKRAADELGEEVADLERRSQMEKLAAVEEQLEKILEAHKKHVAATKKAHGARQETDPHYDREARQEMASASKGERLASGDVETVRGLLVKEGSTVVFPEVLEDVVTDLKTISKRLDDEDPGATTQRIQQDVTETLEELIASVREELSKGPGRGRGGGGGQGGGGQCPLVPPIAELRMLRLQQIRIQKGTVRVDTMVQSKELSDTDARTESKRLARQQDKVLKLAEKMAAKMQQGRPQRVPAGEGQ